MPRTICFTVTLVLLTFVGTTSAAQKPERNLNLVPSLANGTTDALAGSIRGYLVRTLPNPLYEASPGWGNTARTWRGTKKQGQWRKIHVTALNPADTLVFDIRDAHLKEPGVLAFTAFLGFEARVEHRWQRWAAGVMLYDTSVRARFHSRVTLQCEVAFRLECGSLMLPELVCQLRVAKSDIQFDHVVVEHIAGLGGDAAEVLGDTIRGGLRQWHPSLERKLLGKAEASLVRAADAKEVRFRLTQFLQKQTQSQALHKR